MNDLFDISAMKIPLKESIFVKPIEPTTVSPDKLSLSELSPLLRLLAVLEDPANRVTVPRGCYHQYAASSAWKNKSYAMREYFKTCAICNSTKKLCVHHKHYNTVGHEGLEDLVVLCGDHHWEFEEKRIKNKEQEKTAE
jgi:hypothetical protein